MLLGDGARGDAPGKPPATPIGTRLGPGTPGGRAKPPGARPAGWYGVRPIGPITPAGASTGDLMHQPAGAAVRFRVAALEVWALDDRACRAMPACAEHSPVPLHEDWQQDVDLL